MKKVWINKTNSFDSADEFNEEYYLKMGSYKRVETMQYLREIYYKIKKKKGKNESRKRLRRHIKIIQQV